MNKKIYCGTAKKEKTPYGEITKIKLNVEDLNKIIAYMRDNGEDWINIDIKPKRNIISGKPTHYMEIATWKPNFNKLPPFNDEDELHF